MKNIYILIKTLMLTLIVCIPQINMAQALDMEMEDSYESTFTTRSLSNYQIKGFEKRALQKITDFADYLSIVSNTEYDEKLRKQAIDMITKQFLEKETTVTGVDKELSKPAEFKLDQYLNLFLTNKYSKIEVKHSDIKYLNNIVIDEKGNYKGKIYFKQTSNYYVKDKFVSSAYSFRHINIYLIKTKKKFGSKKEDIWNVFLGDLEAVKY